MSPNSSINHQLTNGEIGATNFEPPEIDPDDFARAVMDRHIEQLNEEPSEERTSAARQPLAELLAFLVEVEEPDPVEAAIEMCEHLRRKIPGADWRSVAKHRYAIWQEIKRKPIQKTVSRIGEANETSARQAFEFLFWPIYQRLNDDGQDGARAAFIEIVVSAGSNASEVIQGVQGFAEFCRIAKVEPKFIPKAKNWLRDGSFRADWVAKATEFSNKPKSGTRQSKPSRSVRSQVERVLRRRQAGSQ